MVGEMRGGVVGWDWSMEFSIAIYDFTHTTALSARQSYHLHLSLQLICFKVGYSGDKPIRARK